MSLTLENTTRAVLTPTQDLVLRGEGFCGSVRKKVGVKPLV